MDSHRFSFEERSCLVTFHRSHPAPLWPPPRKLADCCCNMYFHNPQGSAVPSFLSSNFQEASVCVREPHCLSRNRTDKWLERCYNIVRMSEYILQSGLAHVYKGCVTLPWKCSSSGSCLLPTSFRHTLTPLKTKIGANNIGWCNYRPPTLEVDGAIISTEY